MSILVISPNAHLHLFKTLPILSLPTSFSLFNPPPFHTPHFPSPPHFCNTRTACFPNISLEQMTASSCFNPTNSTGMISQVVQMLQTNSKNEADSQTKIAGEEEGSSKTVTRECRICQEEDDEHELESPCACNGTLKFAHRKCIQKWCNKKGDITCEICNQIYSPDYALPPARTNPDVMTIDIRHAWGPQIDLRDAHFLAFASENQFLEPDYEDYGVGSNNSIAYLRFMALILMLILLIRQALLVTRDLGMLPESSKFFNFQVSVLQLVGLLLPCYVVGRSWIMILRQRRRQVG
ncbi:putative E3 ubiquitin-protein ligase MARCH [Helianthus annuus]|nr:putative E3 ubiquitin-protein ligase MARCH [Helianthus annuus]